MRTWPVIKEAVGHLVLRAEAVAELVQCLSHMHKTLDLIPEPQKSDVVGNSSIPALEVEAGGSDI